MGSTISTPINKDLKGSQSLLSIITISVWVFGHFKERRHCGDSDNDDGCGTGGSQRRQQPQHSPTPSGGSVSHPETGRRLGRHTMRCECGGVTGDCRTTRGWEKWSAHVTSPNHLKWGFTQK